MVCTEDPSAWGWGGWGGDPGAAQQVVPAWAWLPGRLPGLLALNCHLQNNKNSNSSNGAVGEKQRLGGGALLILGGKLGPRHLALNLAPVFFSG